MTETEQKLQDAGTQMRIAIANSSDELIFRSCINGYVALARSVTMVMERESGSGPLKEWYKSTVASLAASPVFKFFNSQRVYSIHKGVLSPRSVSHRAEKARFWSEQGDSEKQVLAGEMEISAERLAIAEDDVMTVSSTGEVTAWIFDDVEEFVPGDTGNVLRLCETYFVGLKWLIQEWVKQRSKQA